jgi:predicted O-methyltransferase YrrM
MTGAAGPAHDAPPTFEFEGGFCWIVRGLPASPVVGPADTMAEPTQSRLVVTEDGTPLPGPHAPHEAIRGIGRGRYSHWSDTLRFSTSDNSNPLHNGRRYELVAGGRAVLLAAADVDAAYARDIDRALEMRRARVSDVHEWFRHTDRHGWTLDLRELCARHAASPREGGQVGVFENGRPLRRASRGSADVREQGEGQFHLDWPYLSLAATDNTNPKLNGRRYTVELDGTRLEVPVSPQAVVLGRRWHRSGAAVEALVREAFAAGARVRLPEGWASLDYRRFLAGLVRRLGARRIVEIGTDEGYSSLAMSCALPDGDAAIVTIDLGDRAARLAGLRGVHRVIGDAMSMATIRRVLDLVGRQGADLLFVDSGHDYETTAAHLGAYAALLRPAVVVVDDIVHSEQMAEFWADLREAYGERAVDACDVDPRIRSCDCGLGVLLLRES